MRTNIKDPERILLLQVGAGGGGGPPAPASVALTYSSASVIVTSDRHHGPQAARYFVFYVCICKFVCHGFDFANRWYPSTPSEKLSHHLWDPLQDCHCPSKYPILQKEKFQNGYLSCNDIDHQLVVRRVKAEAVSGGPGVKRRAGGAAGAGGWGSLAIFLKLWNVCFFETFATLKLLKLCNFFNFDF